jgi:peptidoglycan-associated lipoprotein
MNAMNLSKLLVLALALSLPVVGCKKKPTGVTDIPGGSGGTVGNAGPSTIGEGGTLGGDGGAPGGGALANMVDFEGMLMDTETLKNYTVYFEFDSAVVRSIDESNVDAVASELQSVSANKLLIEGHCDERGTEEYNRALGERRALALREALVGKGISPDRIRTLSYGEDRPADPAMDEVAYAKNRRGEFILLLPKE